jgi:hypothetical protein
MNGRFLFSQRGIFMNRNIISTSVDLNVYRRICSFAGYPSHSILKFIWEQARYLIPSYFVTFYTKYIHVMTSKTAWELLLFISLLADFFTGKVPKVRRLSSDREWWRFPQVYDQNNSAHQPAKTVAGPIEKWKV